MARVRGLGHVGIYVRDLARMVAFYRDVMGMTITKQNWTLGIVFLSADPEAVDHEIALVKGRPSPDDPRLIHQISLRVASLDDLRAFHLRLVAEGYRIDQVVNHASALGCYFFDPEGNDWSAYWYDGVVYSSDWNRGLDVLGLEGVPTSGARRLGHLNPQTQEVVIR